MFPDLSARTILPTLYRYRPGANAIRRPRPLSAVSMIAVYPPSPSSYYYQNCHQYRNWSSAEAKTTPDKRKRKPNMRRGGASSGRIAWVDDKLKEKNSGMPTLCSGCGVEMVSSSSQQSDNVTNDGTKKMAAGTNATQARSRNREKKARYADVFDNFRSKKFCTRCQALKAGNVWKAYDALKDVDAKVFSSQLAHIVARRQFGLCIVVVDATDPEFSSVRNLRDSIRSTPCILAINKVDLLPRPLEPKDVRYIQSRVEKGRARMIGAYGVSSANGTGIVELAEGVLSQLGGRDVFVVGSANVGKSTLVKTFSSLMARTLRLRGKNKDKDDQRREILKNLNVTRSHLPGTTLQAVRIPCFPSTRHALWDTPGIINKSAMAYSLFPSHLMEPLAQPQPIEIPTFGNGRKVRVKKGHSILIEAGWIADELLNNNNDDVVDEHSNAEENQEQNGDEDNRFTLARLDIMEVGRMDVEAFAFLPSCLTIRVVPTEIAPKAATIPQEYVAKVQQLVGMAGNFKDNEVSQPLDIFKGNLKDGIVHFDSKSDGGPGGWIRKDVVFASLGWIMLNHRQSFSVRPWCVQGSLWSKRRSIYPSNLEQLRLGDEEYHDEPVNYADMKEDDPAFMDIQERLQAAVDNGRHEGDQRGRRKNEDRSNQYIGQDDMIQSPDDRWSEYF